MYCMYYNVNQDYLLCVEFVQCEDWKYVFYCAAGRTFLLARLYFK